MYRFIIPVSLVLLSGCSGLVNPFSAAAYVASEYVYDKPPIQFIGYFGKIVRITLFTKSQLNVEVNRCKDDDA